VICFVLDIIGFYPSNTSQYFFSFACLFIFFYINKWHRYFIYLYSFFSFLNLCATNKTCTRTTGNWYLYVVFFCHLIKTHIVVSWEASDFFSFEILDNDLNWHNWLWMINDELSMIGFVCYYSFVSRTFMASWSWLSIVSSTYCSTLNSTTTSGMIHSLSIVDPLGPYHLPIVYLSESLSLNS